MKEACEEFTADAEARKLSEATIYKYSLLFRQLQDFGDDRGVRHLDEFDIRLTRTFRATWKDSAISALKKLERLRAFFRFAHEAGWISENPALRLKNPKFSQRPTMPFEREEMIQILRACDQYTDNYGRTGQANARRLRALLLLLRYSGLRIGDGVTLPKDRIRNGKIFLYTQKTGVPVYLGLLAPRVKGRTHDAVFNLLGQERLGKPWPLRWAASLKKSFGVDPLLDREGQRMRWARRVSPAPALGNVPQGASPGAR